MLSVHSTVGHKYQNLDPHANSHIRHVWQKVMKRLSPFYAHISLGKHTLSKEAWNNYHYKWFPRSNEPSTFQWIPVSQKAAKSQFHMTTRVNVYVLCPSIWRPYQKELLRKNYIPGPVFVTVLLSRYTNTVYLSRLVDEIEIRWTAFNEKRSHYTTLYSLAK